MTEVWQWCHFGRALLTRPLVGCCKPGTAWHRQGSHQSEFRSNPWPRILSYGKWKLGQKYILSEKKCGQRKILSLKTFGKKITGSETFWVWKNFGSKKNIGPEKIFVPPKTFVSEKIVGPKKFRVWNFFFFSYCRFWWGSSCCSCSSCDMGHSDP